MYPIPVNEKERLHELLNYQILDSSPENEFDDMVMIITKTFNVPLAAISFIDSERQWVKTHIGFGACEFHRGQSVCSYALMQDTVLEVEDLQADDRFNGFPGIADAPYYRFYAGVPLVTKRGYNIGVLCIIDHQVRRLNKDDYYMLLAFARNVVTQLEIRLENLLLQRGNDIQKRISCALSHDIKSPMANVKMMLDMQEEIEGNNASPESKEVKKMLRKGVDDTMNMLNNMIQWGKLQLDETATVTQFNLRQLADEALNEVYDSNCLKYNTLVNAIPEQIIVTADYGGVRFVLRNLLTNAGKFTARGYITVACENVNGIDVMIVKDTGVGMSADITERLNRSGKVTTTNGTHNETGHGLGLNLVKEYLARQKKELCFRSTIGAGTIASFVV